MKPLTGKEAQAQLKKCLNDYEKEAPFKYPYLSYGYFKETISGEFAGVEGTLHRWTAFDNTNGHCFTESFATEQEALAWLRGDNIKKETKKYGKK